MTRFSVKLSNILGLSFYRYELTSSNYNPEVRTLSELNTYTITCKVTDIFGNPISGKQLTLYKNGSSVSDATTLSTGIATWLEYSSTWGTIDYNVSNAHCQVHVGGFKEVTNYSNGFYKLEVNEQTRQCRLTHDSTSNNQNIGTGERFVQSNWIPSTYRPQGDLITPLSRAYNTFLQVGTSGTVKLYNNTNGTLTANNKVQIDWSY